MQRKLSHQAEESEFYEASRCTECGGIDRVQLIRGNMNSGSNYWFICNECWANGTQYFRGAMNKTAEIPRRLDEANEVDDGLVEFQASVATMQFY